MQRDTELRLLRELIRQLDEKRNVDAGEQVRVPTRSYVCPDLAAREWERFFRGHPQLIGLSGDLPQPGHFFTVDDFGVPVLATRDDHGRFRAFVNACRHRGTRVAEGRGESRHFMCPFHNWTYANDGALVGISRERDFGKVDRTCNGLVPLPCEERFGLLWVHPDPGGRLDVEALLGGLAPEIASWNVGELLYQGETLIEKRLNWKLCNDTFGETYHFSRLHRNTLGKIFYGDALAYEVFGRNHRFVFANRRIDALRGQPEESWDIEGKANVLYYLFPNIQFNAGRGQVALIRIYPHPEDPARSITRVSHYFSQPVIASLTGGNGTRIGAHNVYDPEAREGKVQFSLEATMEVFDSTIEREDYQMGETTQRTAESGALEYLVFGRNEPALHHYHDTYREALGMPPLERISLGEEESA